MVIYGYSKKNKEEFGYKKNQTAENIGLPYNVQLPDSMANLQDAIDVLNKSNENVSKDEEEKNITEPVRLEAKKTKHKKAETQVELYENAIDKEIAKKTYEDLQKESHKKNGKKGLDL